MKSGEKVGKSSARSSSSGESGRDRVRIASAALALIAAVTVGHYAVPVTLPSLHELFKVLYFVPILVAAYGFGLRGGLLASGLVTVVYLPHVMFQWGGGFLPNLSRFFMILLYVGLGGLAGFLWQRQREERDRYRSAAEQLTRSLERLEATGRELAEIEGQLRSAERLATLGELTASLAHEVRNPLGSIRGAAEILRDESGAGRHRKFIDILLAETKRLDEVVAGYLSFAKPRAVAREALRLDELVRSVLSLIGPELRRCGISARVDIRPVSLRVLADGNQIRQALLNVLLNAVEASPRDSHIEITASADRGQVTLTVADQGEGASPEDLPRLFDPFFTTRKEGIGLGLAITRRIIENHGGTLRAINRTPRGLAVSLGLQENRD